MTGLEAAADRILTYSEVRDLIAKDANHRGTILSNLQEMLSNIDPALVRTMSTIVGAGLNKVYDGFDIQVAGNLDLAEYMKERQVVFVPNHQSHADYVVFNYLLHKQFGISSYTAGGINLNIFMVGRFFRNMGCIFIRRSFANDVLYKATLKAYVRYIMEGFHPLEFYFEGGRSRNGMLLTPKFGMFNMIIDNYRQMKAEGRPTKGLAFIPASIVHETLPEQKALAREVEGGKKNPESFLQFLKIAKLARKHFGHVYVRLGKPVEYADERTELRVVTQNIAFACYREVGRGITVTPIALVSTILLDGPMGGMTWDRIVARSEEILNYCREFGIPIAGTLTGPQWADALRAGAMFLESNHLIEQIYMPNLDGHFFAIPGDRRIELVYFKNTLLHHFLIPFLIFLSWVKIRRNELKTVEQLADFLLERRKELKFEFYIPSISDMWKQGIKMISYILQRPVRSLEEGFNLTKDEQGALQSKLGLYGNFFRYKYEAYYIGALTLLTLKDENFVAERYMRLSREIFTLEQMTGQIIKHAESYSLPVIRNALTYATNKGWVKETGGKLNVVNADQIRANVAQYSQDLLDIYQMNLENALYRSSGKNA